jgi:MFS family permease
LDTRILLNFLAVFLPMASVTMNNAGYALYLEDTLDISPSYSGYVLAISTGTYAILCPLVSILMQKMNRRLLIFITILITSLSNIFIGDTRYLGLENTLTTHVISRLLRGVSPGIFIPTIPEYLEFLKIKYPNYAQNHLNDVASALWNASFFLGEIIGPVFGSYSIEKYGFLIINTIAGFIIVGLALIYCIRFAKYFFKLNKSYLDYDNDITEELKDEITKSEI